MEEAKTSASELVIPIYLDTNTVLDLLASVEGGYTTVEMTQPKHLAAKLHRPAEV